MTPDKRESPANREQRPQHRSLAPSPSRRRNLLSRAFFPGKLLDCHWAQPWIEASNIKHSLPVPDLQFLEAVPAGHWSLRTPPCVGLSSEMHRASLGFASSVCCWPCQPLGPAQTALRCLTHTTHLSGFYYNCQIPGVPESFSSASEFLTPQSFVFHPILRGFL